MNCEAIRALLSDRLDDELETSLHAQVESHLAACSPCRDLATRLASMIEDLALLSDIPIPHGLGDRMAARVPAPLAFRDARGGSTQDLRRVAGWAAVMILMSLTLLGRGFTGRLADGVAPILAEAKQQAMKSELRGEGLLARLNSGAEKGFDRLADAAFHRER